MGMNKKELMKKKRLENAVTFFSILLIFIFCVGVHNMDNCANLRVMNAETDSNYAENNLLFKNISGETCYSIGMYLVYASGFLLGFIAVVRSGEVKWG